MSNSCVSNHVHIVFSTTNRMKLIAEDLQAELWAYIAGIAKNHGMHAVAVGGIDDHVHALIHVGSSYGIATAVQILKANSSRWMNEYPRVRFAWQEGYFACSVSRSQTATVRKYIANQKEHHRKMDSTKEFEVLLRKHGLASAR